MRCISAHGAAGRKQGGRWLTYRELAEELPAYVRDLGFTHVEFLPVTEHPFDGSWGYQPTGLFAPTSRFGTPADFAALVDACHRAGFAVLLDWVPGHFPDDPHGLGRFDGTALYEHANPKQGRHLDWNTLIYNYGRTEVANFLLASGLFWLDRYRVDGLRVDAVASMLYLDYSRPEGGWIPNRYGGRENLDAIAFLRRFNTEAVRALSERDHRCRGIDRLADGVAAGRLGRPRLRLQVEHGMDARHAGIHQQGSRSTASTITVRSCSACTTRSPRISSCRSRTTRSCTAKRSILGRMPGDDWQRFANLRAYYGFMFGHPGKKLLFMGNEFGQQSRMAARSFTRLASARSSRGTPAS